MYSIIADLHTHTLSATHAYDTLEVMAAAAKQMGYKALAITDHGPAMPDAPHIWHFQNWGAVPHAINGVFILRGAEANVMDTKGTLDLSEQQLCQQDWVVASIHSPCVPGTLTEKEATRLWLSIAENPFVDCIGHSEQQVYRYDYDLVTKAFAANGKIVEMNGNSFNVRKDGIPNMKELLLACKKNNCQISIDSDAHSVLQLTSGFDRLYEILEQVKFPLELIANANSQNFVNVLRQHNKSYADEIGGALL